MSKMFSDKDLDIKNEYKCSKCLLTKPLRDYISKCRGIVRALYCKDCRINTFMKYKENSHKRKLHYPNMFIGK